MTSCICRRSTALQLCEECIEKYINTWNDVLEINRIKPMNENKVLINPKDYDKINIGEELEVTLLVKTLKKSTDFDSCFDFVDDESSKLSIIEKSAIKAIYKIIPKATPLEVGEVVNHVEGTSDLKVLHIHRHKQLTMLNLSTDYVYSTRDHITALVSPYTEYYRASGIPIDWDATFNQ